MGGGAGGGGGHCPFCHCPFGVLCKEETCFRDIKDKKRRKRTNWGKK